MSNNYNENDVKAKIDSFLPDKASDDPKQILKSDKKLYSGILIAVITLAIIGNLIGVIIGFISSPLLGVASIFLGSIATAVVLLMTSLFISIAHNLSRTTKATMLMCEKMLSKDENNQEKKEEKRVQLKILPVVLAEEKEENQPKNQ